MFGLRGNSGAGGAGGARSRRSPPQTHCWPRHPAAPSGAAAAGTAAGSGAGNRSRIRPASAAGGSPSRVAAAGGRGPRSRRSRAIAAAVLSAMGAGGTLPGEAAGARPQFGRHRGRRSCRSRRAGAGDAGGALASAIEPVTESSPCSSTETREYSRSRSPLRVSMAEASRRVSLWLSLATDWICCDCRARSAAATWSRRHPIEDWLASTATTTAPTEATPHEPSRHSERRSKSSSSAKNPLSTPPVFSVSRAVSPLLAISSHTTSLALPRPGESHGKH